MNYVEIDHHRQYSHMMVMDQTVKIAHPNEVKAIACSKIKTNKRTPRSWLTCFGMNMIAEFQEPFVSPAPDTCPAKNIVSWLSNC